jgi:ubiquinone/menaquinone biosynthesis C-methylase UbiE
MTSQPPTDEERKQQTAANFDAVAQTYDHAGYPFVLRAAARLVELASPLSGERVLDVATGTGWAALDAARAVGPTGHVMATDLAAEMLGPARAKAALAGLANIEFRTGDAEAPDLPDGSVDLVLCASAIFAFPHPNLAVHEWHRVTRPGGRVHFSTWASPNLGRLLDLYDLHIQRFLPAAPVRRLRLFNATECATLLLEAGFEEVRVVEERLDYVIPDGDSLWAHLDAAHYVRAHHQLSEGQRSAFRRGYLADVERLRTPAGIPVEDEVIFASGVVPLS